MERTCELASPCMMHCLNKCHQFLNHSTGNIVCCLANDDLWFPGHLERMAEALIQHDIVHSETLIFISSGS